jgi:hypothetical protein
VSGAVLLLALLALSLTPRPPLACEQRSKFYALFFGTSWDTRDSGSLALLDLSNNEIDAKGAKHVAEMLPKW